VAVRGVMIVLIVMPMSWLAVYAFTDKARSPTLQNFVKLFTDPDFLDPLLTTAIIATRRRRSAALSPRRSAGWYRAHRYAGAPDHPGAGDRIVRDAAVSRRRCLGIAGRRPNSGLLNQLYRFITQAADVGRAYLQHLFADRNHLRDLLLHVSVRVRAWSPTRSIT